MLNLRRFFLLFILILTAGFTQAENSNRYKMPFTIGLGLQPTSLDPYYKEDITANNTILLHLFEPLYQVGRSGYIEPVLAKAYEVEDPLRWLFTLKKNIKFHDGHNLTSDDVIATLDQISQLGKNHTRRQDLGELKYTKVNSHQFRIETLQPDPGLLRRLVDVLITSKHQAGADSSAYASGAALIGTGPYQWVKHSGLTRFELKAFADYHGQHPYIQKLIIKAVTDKATRLAGFSAENFDMIDRLNADDTRLFLENQSARVSMPTGTAFYHITLDQHRDQSPFIFNHQGQPLQQNPLKDRRVREAISKAINRQQLVDQFFGGKGAAPTGQLVPDGLPGHMPNWPADNQDIAQAAQLLAEAGYGEGFQLTLHDKDARKPILESIAAMLARINIQTTVKTFPPAEYFPKMLNHDFSAALTFYESYGTIQHMLTNLLQTGRNIGRYSNPDFDAQLIKSTTRFSPDVRYREYAYVTEMAMRDYGLIPLYFINTAWVIRKDMAFIPTPRAYTLAQQINPN